MNTNERKIVVENLQQLSFLKINGAVKLLDHKLNISHHTVYKYLREMGN